MDGSISLVGSRPQAAAHKEQYRQLICGSAVGRIIKPGVTGLTQVDGRRGETETLEKMERRIDWEHRYIRTWSQWPDLKILFPTKFSV